MKKLLLLAFVVLGFSAVSFGQSTATASSTAVLVTPISIQKTTDLNFGTLAASATAGTVDLDFANGRTSSSSVKLLPGTALEKTAVFTVSGEAGSAITINYTAPTEELVMTGPTSGMIVTNFEMEETSDGKLTLPTGTGLVSQTLHVKAQLKVPANAAAGQYKNESGLFVTVNYE